MLSVNSSIIYTVVFDKNNSDADIHKYLKEIFAETGWDIISAKVDRGYKFVRLTSDGRFYKNLKAFDKFIRRVEKGEAKLIGRLGVFHRTKLVLSESSDSYFDHYVYEPSRRGVYTVILKQRGDLVVWEDVMRDPSSTQSFKDKFLSIEKNISQYDENVIANLVSEYNRLEMNSLEEALLEVFK